MALYRPARETTRHTTGVTLRSTERECYPSSFGVTVTIYMLPQMRTDKGIVLGTYGSQEITARVEGPRVFEKIPISQFVIRTDGDQRPNYYCAHYTELVTGTTY